MGEAPRLDPSHEQRVFPLCAAQLLQLVGTGGKKALPAALPGRAMGVVTDQAAAALRRLAGQPPAHEAALAAAAAAAAVVVAPLPPALAA